MKKILLSFLFLVLPAISFAGYDVNVTGDHASPVSGGAHSDYYGNDASHYLTGQQFLTSGAGYICTITSWQGGYGENTRYADARIFSDSGSHPNTNLGTSGTTTVSTSGTYTFTFSSSVAVSASTNYWTMFNSEGDQAVANLIYIDGNASTAANTNSCTIGMSCTDLGNNDLDIHFHVWDNSNCTDGTAAGGTSSTSTLQTYDNPGLTIFLGILLYIFGFGFTYYLIFY